MKFEVGDKVRVKSNLEPNKIYGTDSFTTSMMDFCGKVVTIQTVSNLKGKYTILESDRYFTDQMLEDKVAESDDQVIDVTNFKETRIFRVGDKVKIRDDLSQDMNFDGWMVTKGMLKYCGLEVTIEEVAKDSDGVYYGIKEDNNINSWTVEMFSTLPYRNLTKSGIAKLFKNINIEQLQEEIDRRKKL